MFLLSLALSLIFIWAYQNNSTVKQPVIFTLIILLFAGCAQKHLQNGRYDDAIRISVRKLKKKPNNAKHLRILEQAFLKANQRDNDRINYLKKEGTPDIWDDVFNVYSTMKQRQSKVKTLSFIPPRITFVDYDEEIIQAKRKAAEYFYAHGVTLLEKGDRQSARLAYNDFQKVKKYFSDFKDVNDKIRKAEELGTNHVIFKMQNKANVILPKRFAEELFKISLNDLNRQWLVYHTQEQSGLNYDYTVLVNIKMIDVSPEQVKEVHYTETAEIKDGWQYVLDSKGNVMKDSLGNDLKTDKIITVACNIIETQQRKSARIAGSMDYINNQTGQLIKTDPITADAVFENFSAMTVGDQRALKKETKAKTGKTPVPFPPDPDMLMQAGNTLKDMVKNILYANKSLLN